MVLLLSLVPAAARLVSQRLLAARKAATDCTPLTRCVKATASASHPTDIPKGAAVDGTRPLICWEGNVACWGAAADVEGKVEGGPVVALLGDVIHEGHTDALDDTRCDAEDAAAATTTGADRARSKNPASAATAAAFATETMASSANGKAPDRLRRGTAASPATHRHRLMMPLPLYPLSPPQLPSLLCVLSVSSGAPTKAISARDGSDA